jgi:hypothetical protein
MNGSGKAEYSFTDIEIKNLALLLRKNEAGLDENLDVFRCFLENYIYRIMTIEEAEVFFDEKTTVR